MKLRTQSLWFLAFAAGASLLLVGAVTTAVLLPSADRSDRAAMAQALVRLHSRIEHQIGQVEAYAQEYGPWTDTFEFAEGGKPDYVEANFQPSSFENSGMRLVVIWGDDGRRLLSRLHDPAADEVRAVPESTLVALESWPGVLRREEGEVKTGVLATPQGLLLFAALPITRDSGEPPEAGTFFAAQALDPKLIARLSAGESHTVELAAEAGSAPGGAVEFLDGGRMRSTLRIDDGAGKPVARLVVTSPRFVRQVQVHGLRVTFTALSIGISLLGAVTWWAVRVRFLRRVEDLTEAVGRLETDGATRLRLSSDPARDEIGSLARATGCTAIALADAREAAEAATRAKGDFLATMSHEIRTPLNGVLGYLGLLRESGLTPEQTAHVEVIRESGDALLAVINEILDYSKLENGRVTLESVPTDVAALAAEVVALFEPRLRAKGVAASLRIEPGLPPRLWADPLRLRQVLTNLVSNAEKFTAAGEVAVALERSAGDGAGRPEMRIRVIDTGIGLTAEQAGSLFRPFVQADSSTTRRFGGTGLGLAICHRLVAAWGGELTVSSRAGEGAVFAFTLPLREAPAPARIKPAPDTDGAPPANVPDAGLRILIAEDNAVNARLLLAVLARLGHRAERVGDGQEALTALRQRPFDLVLMDVQMPDVDGLEATRRQRAWERATGRPPVHIAALTANALVGAREECLAAGMDDFLAKPYQIGEVRDLLARAALRRAADAGVSSS